VRAAAASAVIEATVVVEHVEPTAAERLGVDGTTTLLAVRPDGYVGLRADRDHASALQRYLRDVTGRS
jgi:hypothetical protein